MSGPLAALAAELRAEGTVISGHVVDPPPEARADLGALAAAGPVAADAADAYAAIVESVREGYLLHYGRPRLLDPPDEDLALLAGDYMYAKGLERLAALGDLTSVRELSDLISLSAQLHADGPAGPADPAAAALWLASTAAIAAGPSEAHEAAKRALRERGSAAALGVAASETAARAGLDQQLARAAETVGFRAPDRG